MDNYGSIPGPSKPNAIIEIFNKYRGEVSPDISDEKLKELIGESVDDVIEKHDDLGSYAGWHLYSSKEVYENTQAKVNKYLSDEPSNSSVCNVLDCFNQIPTEQMDNSQKKKKPIIQVPPGWIKAMDEPNKQAANIMNTQGMDAAVAHMTEGMREGKMSYAEMRYLYG
jgi:hypothetical protein